MLKSLRSGGVYIAAAALLAALVAAGAALLQDTAPRQAMAVPLPGQVMLRIQDDTAYAPALHAALAAHRAAPQDAALALAAARIAVDEGRARGEARIVGTALGILRPFLEAGSAGVLRVAADARQYQHDFPGALALLNRAVALDPADAGALLMRATIQTVRGAYGPAREDCARIAAVGRSDVAFLCAATTHVLTAEGPQWARRLDAALERPGVLDPALHPWALGLLAEIARHQGMPARAAGLLRRVLALDPDALRERLMLADLLLAGGAAAEALDLLAGAPPVDGVLLRRALALQAMGDGRAQPLVRELDRQFRLNIDLGLDAHAREEAMFYLYLGRDPALALARAEVNWAMQHEAEDIALLLAAAGAAGAAPAAAPARDWMAAAGVTAPPPQAWAEIPSAP